MLLSVQKSCSPHLAYLESLLRRLACPGGWYLEISWAHTTCENLGRLVNCSPHRTFACNHAIGCNANGTVKECPFWGGRSKRYYALLPSWCVQNFGLIVIRTTHRTFFLKSRWAHTIMACHGKCTVQISGDKLLQIVDFTSNCYIWCKWALACQSSENSDNRGWRSRNSWSFRTV